MGQPSFYLEQSFEPSRKPKKLLNEDENVSLINMFLMQFQGRTHKKVSTMKKESDINT